MTQNLPVAETLDHDRAPHTGNELLPPKPGFGHVSIDVDLSNSGRRIRLEATGQHAAIFTGTITFLISLAFVIWFFGG